VKPVGVAVFQVSVTELILGFGTPFNLSLVNTLGVVPPVVLVIVVTPSFTASIVVGVVVFRLERERIALLRIIHGPRIGL